MYIFVQKYFTQIVHFGIDNNTTSGILFFSNSDQERGFNFNMDTQNDAHKIFLSTYYNV